MSYRFAYPNVAPAVAATPVHGYGVDPVSRAAGYSNGAGANMYSDRSRRSYSRRSFSSGSGSDDDYEYRGRLITRETRCPRDIVRAPTPPPIIKRVVERAPTPEARIMERVIIRPQAQEIVERVIEQPRTPPPRIIQKEMHEEAPPPIVRTRVIKVDRPLHGGYSQSGTPFAAPYDGHGCRTRSVAGSVGRPVAYHSALNNNPSYSSASSFEYAPSTPITPAAPASTATMMMMPPAQHIQSVSAMQNQQAQPISFMQSPTVPNISVIQSQQQQQPVQSMNLMQQQPVQSMNMMMQQQPVQPINMMQQQPTPAMGVMQQQLAPSMNFMQQPSPFQQQFSFRPVQIQPSIPQMMPQTMSSFPPSSYIPQNLMYSGQQGMSYGYRPMMHQGGMIPSGMPMMAAGSTIRAPTSGFPTQRFMFNSFPQQSVF